MEHLGALPYLAAQKALTAPVFATLPVARMGQMVMYDQQLAHHAASDFTLFNMDTVDAAFKQICELKYHQIHRLQGNICLGGLVNPCLPSSLVTLSRPSRLCIAQAAGLRWAYYLRRHKQNSTPRECCLTCAKPYAVAPSKERACGSTTCHLPPSQVSGCGQSQVMCRQVPGLHADSTSSWAHGRWSHLADLHPC